MRFTGRLITVITSYTIWQWVHNHDNFKWYNNHMGTDGWALIVAIGIGACLWYITDELTK